MLVFRSYETCGGDAVVLDNGRSVPSVRNGRWYE